MRKILATFLLLSLLSAFTTRSLADEQPNIIFILADDHTSQAWGCYGSRLTPFFKTPNIDRIAAEGVKLTNSFCTNSICVPSRAAILTGQYGHKSGVKMLSDSLSPEKDNLAKQLRKLGYTTALVGKWHLKKEPAGFDYWNIIKGQGRYHNPTMYEMSLAKENGKTETGTYCSDLFTDSALNWLKKKRDKKKPFCLMLHFKATHEPWDFHPRHAKLYADVQFPLPEDLHTSHPGPKNTPFAGWPLEILEKRMVNGGKKYGAPPLNVEGMTPKERREATYQKFLKSYLRCVAAIDENIGRVLHYLDEEKLEIGRASCRERV